MNAKTGKFGPETFKTAIAGFGWWGQHIARRLTDHTDIVVLGVAEPDVTRQGDIAAAGLEWFHSLDVALMREDVDAVILTTPNLLHEEQVVLCAQSGKHVFCEKPLGLTAASARRSVAACKKAGVQLGIGHERRFESAMLTLKSAIERSELGTIMHAEAAFSHDKLIHVPKGDWRTSASTAPAAGMTAMGIHLTDLLISFFGRVETVQAMTSDRSLGWETGDVVTVQLGFEAGMTASLSAIMHTPHFIRMHVFGSDKWIEIRNASHPDTPGGKVSYVEALSGTSHVEKTLDWNDAVIANLEAFRRAVIGEASYPFTLEEMVHNIEVLEAITLSTSDHRTVRIDSL